MAAKYNPHKIESKWRAIWPEQRDSFTVNDGDEPYYVLDMISYPSSEGLHMGHWRPYTIADVCARYQTMQGKKVLSPVGFDAFGLPAENAAIKSQTPPQEYTARSITNFSRQIKEMGKMYDWSTLQVTSSPEYYKWTQWLFLQLYHHGLAYRKSSAVQWCPSCQTVLANEQVIDGKCERCGTPVIKKQLKQWFLKITDFAENLLDFSEVNWPERVKTSQVNWIGKSEGAEIDFPVADQDWRIKVFTTRPDTLFGTTSVVVAPEYPNLDKLITPEQSLVVKEYIGAAQQKSEIDRLTEDKKKTGVFTGSYVLHPLTQERLPIWVADYVIGSYGTGAVMGVPAHDARDYQFAKDYDLPIIFVVEPKDQPADETKAYVNPGIVINSEEFSGLPNQAAKKTIVEALEKLGFGKQTIQYRLRDWLVSRQRYWGAPIPIIYCEQCGEQAVPETDLPVVLPLDVAFTPTGGSPLERSESFKNTVCPQCSGAALRETDTLDTFVDSSWYYLRFTSPHDATQPFDKEQIKKWLPVDFYVGGVEHSILHLLYSRFIMHALHRLDLIPYREPFKQFYGNGMVYLYGQKMSKSKGNVINPDDMVKKYGTDAMRGYILFMGPADQDVEWQSNGILGVSRFLEKAWHVFGNVKPGETQETADFVRQAINSVTDFLTSLQFNRCISALMIAINAAEKNGVNQEEAERLIRLFAPFFPHFAEEVWQQLGHTDSIFTAPWPAQETVTQERVTYAVQVNGKLKATLAMPREADEPDVVEKARALPALAVIKNQNIQKVVFVAGRIVNFVVQ